ncbi:hypothetical protein O181_046592 [Austropuccinia psidii MF-1]|uniref:Tf2-1-like SH3-like domain-containing protein n=1 Tax=Austropuccinia psidii MF-1 TaxID=1389203 RepID=A0A9Q3HJU2_9BASI|nr:hypothetical protein [Austropuccinia psidii MF-1]
MEPDFREGDQVCVSTLSLQNLKRPKKMRESFVGPFTIIKLIGKNAMEVKLTEEFCRKHPVFPARKIRLNGKDQRQYLLRFKSQTADKDKRLEEDTIPDGKLHLRRFRSSRRTEQSH